jgi:hypothetical protein
LDLISRVPKPGRKRPEINQRNWSGPEIFISDLEVADMGNWYDAVIDFDLPWKLDHFGLTRNTKRIRPCRIYDGQSRTRIDGKPCRAVIDPNRHKEMITGGSAQQNSGRSLDRLCAQKS